MTIPRTDEYKLGIWRVILQDVHGRWLRTVTVEGYRRGSDIEHDALTQYEEAAGENAVEVGSFVIEETTNEFVFPGRRQAFFVTVYEVGRAYGGPEEGGWWFDTGEPIEHFICDSFPKAELVRLGLKSDYPATGMRSSVLGGEDYEVRIGLRPGVAYPEETPRYE